MLKKIEIPTVLALVTLSLVPIFHISMAAKKNYIIHMSKSEMPAEFKHHKLWYMSSLKSVSTSSKMLYSYDHVIDGFSASLTDEEAQQMAAQIGVLSVEPESRHKLHTTRTPTFLGLDILEHEYKYKWLVGQQQSVVIGFIDNGIWPESKSFDDTGYGPIPSSWRGKCKTGPHFDISMCNKKLIGARYFVKGFESTADPPVNWSTMSRSTRDDVGHGTHVTSIAAGSATPSANLFGYANGTARGMAPWVRVAAYKMCWNGTCTGSDTLMAIDAAISDGVNVLSISLGYSSGTPFYEDSIIIGAFTAAANGIFVSCSAGNSGPDPSSVENAAPWIATIGAGTIDRDFPAYVKLGNGETYGGVSLYSGPPLPLPPRYIPFVYAGNVSKNGSSFCMNGSLIPKKVKGKIVLCDRGMIDSVEKGMVVKEAGGVGMVLANTKDEAENYLFAYAHLLPAVNVGQKVGDEIKKYLSSVCKPIATIQFGGTRLGIVPSPMVADFSSRGPNPITPQVLKPDLIAPGLEILGAWSGSRSPTKLSIDTRRVNFNIQSGTSMSCPHVSGLAALLKAAQPEWSPAAIRSALMTTAYTTDKRGNLITDESTGNVATPFDYGAGHVNPLAALDPGLVYNLTTRDYLNFLCAIKYTPLQLKIISRKKFSCKREQEYTTADLNYPSFAIQVPFNINTTYVVTHKRTVTNVGSCGSKYKVSIFSPSNLVKIVVVPRRLIFHKRNEMRSYTVTFKITGPMQPNTHQFGEIKWCDEKHDVRSPIAISWT